MFLVTWSIPLALGSSFFDHSTGNAAEPCTQQRSAQTVAATGNAVTGYAAKDCADSATFQAVAFQATLIIFISARDGIIIGIVGIAALITRTIG